jgi:NNP family nitrate/nitrite transporter-like MFS transporter
MANVHAGLRGRLVCQVVALCMEGILVIVFSFTQTLGGAILVMIIFSVFVQAAEGSTYGIVPYVDPKFTGSIAGFVAAGGNLGGVGFSLLFRGLSDDRAAFLWMGCAVLGSAFFTALIYIRGHRTLLTGVDSYEVTENLATAEVPRFISFASPVDPESATTASTEGPL